MSEQTKNDKAWERIFEKYNLIEEINDKGIVEIKASQIKEFREPRLMTKFDHRNNLPELFKKNRLSILPITRGNYVIGKMKVYHKFEEVNSEIISVKFPDYIESIDYENITSEAVAINTAYVSGILSDFLNESIIMPTVNGRMSSSTFQFDVKNEHKAMYQTLKVENSQIEIDGGYEGMNSLAILEAKNSLSDDFLVRQLYYPYRLWEEKLRKLVRPVFLTYSNGIFTLREYIFENKNIYNSIRLVSQKRYAIQIQEIELKDIISILETTEIVREPQEVPFPQADKFDRVVNLCELLYEFNSLSKDEITLTYDFNVRQTDYYTNAGRYLGLIEKYVTEDRICYRLSAKGNSMFKLNIYRRNLEYIKLILQHKVFNLTLKEYLKHVEMPKKSQIVEYMKICQLNNIEGESTYKRRTSSISSWINWILELVS